MSVRGLGVALAAMVCLTASPSISTEAEQRVTRREVRDVSEAAGFTDARRREARAFEDGLSADQRRAVEEAGAALLALVRERASAVGTRGDAGRRPPLSSALGVALSPYVSSAGSRDPARVSEAVMMSAVGRSEDQVLALANELQANASLHAQIREEIADLREQLADWSPDEDREIVWHDGEGNEHRERLTKTQAEQLLQRLETALASLGDANRQRQLRLQSAMSQHARQLQTLSGMTKQVHDASGVIIQNLR